MAFMTHYYTFLVLGSTKLCYVEIMQKNYPSLRIFKSNLMESFTHVHPILPLVIWGPVAIVLLITGINENKLSLAPVILWAVVGLLVWTLSEYLLHRFVFHFPAKGKWGKRFVFIFHGLHHDDPNDPTRLVMPPLPALIFVVLLYNFYALLIPAEFLKVFFCFFLIGYLVYDYIHYATHHFKMTSPVLKYLKRYHLLHHHAHERSRYGVSSPLWDLILRTSTGEKYSDH
jgi:sterol desaturase/sphingolipid hydroxylase (fatty acid hydroxylase superfamily)